MKIIKKIMRYLFIAIIIMVGCLQGNILQTSAAENIPKIDIVSLDHSPFIEGDSNSFYIVPKSYIGKVQYQLFYTCEKTMKKI